MKLIIDLGNTQGKFAVFKNDEIIIVETINNKAKKDFRVYTDQLIKKYCKEPLHSVILSSVIDYPTSFNKYLKNNFRFLELTKKTPVPVKINYKTPETIGNDRIAIAVAVNYLFPGKNTLAVNAGTCITYDIVDNKEVYQGGAISPGFDMRLRSLHNFTDQLPLIESGECNTVTGKSTDESILSGVMNGTIAEVNGMIDKFSGIYDNLTIIISGGNLKYFDKKLKNNIFAVQNLVLKGLKIILDFNEDF